jgi:hypothetical protein
VDQPLAYFITFRTYGTWLHGDDRGWVDRSHHAYGQPYEDPNPALERFEHSLLAHPPVKLTQAQRVRCECAIRETCGHRGWALHALNVRTNHVHVVVHAPQEPERVMEALKA